MLMAAPLFNHLCHGRLLPALMGQCRLCHISPCLRLMGHFISSKNGPVSTSISLSSSTQTALEIRMQEPGAKALGRSSERYRKMCICSMAHLIQHTTMTSLRENPPSRMHSTRMKRLYGPTEFTTLTNEPVLFQEVLVTWFRVSTIPATWVLTDSNKHEKLAHCMLGPHKPTMQCTLFMSLTNGMQNSLWKSVEVMRRYTKSLYGILTATQGAGAVGLHQPKVLSSLQT